MSAYPKTKYSRMKLTNLLITKIMYIYFRRILCFDPQQRLETEGMPIPVSEPPPVSWDIVPPTPSPTPAILSPPLLSCPSQDSTTGDCSESTIACLLAILIFDVIFDHLSWVQKDGRCPRNVHVSYDVLFVSWNDWTIKGWTDERRSISSLRESLGLAFLQKRTSMQHEFSWSNLRAKTRRTWMPCASWLQRIPRNFLPTHLQLCRLIAGTIIVVI